MPIEFLLKTVSCSIINVLYVSRTAALQFCVLTVLICRDIDHVQYLAMSRKLVQYMLWTSVLDAPAPRSMHQHQTLYQVFHDAGVLLACH